MHFQLKSRQNLFSYDTPIAMGIVNITADSFFKNSRAANEKEILSLAEKHLTAGSSIIDIGAMSTRPGALEIPLLQEQESIQFALQLLRKEFPSAIISVDTYRTPVAIVACDLGADFINDIAAGDDEGMLTLIEKTGIGYMAMHKKGMPADMQQNPVYDNVTKELAQYFLDKNELFKQHKIVSWV